MRTSSVRTYISWMRRRSRHSRFRIVLKMAAFLVSIGFALLAGARAWDYGVPYYPAPHYFEQQQPYDLPCPPSGPESLVCAGAPGAQPSTFPSPCEVQRFRALTGISKYFTGIKKKKNLYGYSLWPTLPLQTGRSFTRIDAKPWRSVRTIARISTIQCAESTRIPGATSGASANCSW